MSRTVSARWRWVAIGIVAVLVAAIVAVFAVGDDRGSSRRTPAAAAVVRPPVLSPLSATAGAPASSGVASALATALRDPAFGGHVTGDVVDAWSGAVLLDRESTTALPPASTVKLLTATAALSALGPDATLPTEVMRAGTTLFLVGGGDVTLRATAGGSAVGYPPAATLSELATRTSAALGSARTSPLSVCIDASAWSGPGSAPGWSPGYFTGGDIARLSPIEVDEGAAVTHHRARAPIPRVADPAGQAGLDFAAALSDAGVSVTKGRPCRGIAPPSATKVASVQSPPVAALVQRMLTLSDNDLAEALGRAVARHARATADFPGEAAAVTAELHGLGVDISGLVLHDASGLSRLDRVDARTLVDVVRLVVGPGHPQLRAVAAGMPVAGLTGTLADRFRRGPASAAAGLARAKTGTLAGVNTIAGYVVDASGRLLVFAFLTDRAVGPDATEAALDRLVGRLATCGCG